MWTIFLMVHLLQYCLFYVLVFWPLGMWDPRSWNREKAMVPHSSTLAWKIPWMEEPGRLQSMGSRRVGHDWATSLSLLTFMHWRRKWQPTPVFMPGESQGWGSLVGCRLWGHPSRTRLKWLSSSSSSWNRDQTHNLCIGRQNPNDWTAREVPKSWSLYSVHSP